MRGRPDARAQVRRVSLGSSRAPHSNVGCTADVARITAPVPFVQGDADIVPPSHAAELFGRLGGGKKDGGED